MLKGVLACVYVRFLKNAEIFKMKFIVVLQFFLLIIIAAWNINQTIMKDYNIQSCQWEAVIAFASPQKITNVGYVKNIF